MAVLIGWIFTLFGVIFFFAGGGGSIIRAILAGRLADVPKLKPQLIFAEVGFGIWLVGIILVAVGLIGARKKLALGNIKSED